MTVARARVCFWKWPECWHWSRNSPKKLSLVFFDGEEAVENFSDTDGIYGSRHFAGELAKDKSAKSIRGGILST